jgi:L-asparaginase
MATEDMRPSVKLFALGGTIASIASGASGSGVSPSLGASELVSAVPGLELIADVESVTFRQVPGGDLRFEDIIALAADIDNCFDTGTTGVVVTQGTDTIEETAFVLGLLVRGMKTVVVTGAMRNPTLLGADGPANILAAVKVAVSPEFMNLGTLVVFSDEIHSAQFVKKSNTSSLMTFNSPARGPLGLLVEGRPHLTFYIKRIEPISISPGALIPPVALHKIVFDDDDRILQQIQTLGYAGLVIEGFGGGHVPSRLVEVIGNLSQNIPVVLASRTGSGATLRETYGFPGSERDLLSRGLINSGSLDGLKSRILLSLLLAAGYDTDGIRKYFDGFSELF